MKKPTRVKIDITDPEGIVKLLNLVNEDMILLREGLASLCNEINRIRAFDKILMRVMDKAGIIDEPDVKKLSDDLYKKQAKDLIQRYRKLTKDVEYLNSAYDTMEESYSADFSESDFDEDGVPIAEA